MKELVQFSDFCDRFRSYERNENFSYDAKKLLFNYLEEYEKDVGEEITLDIIGLCCEYSEDALETVLEDYGLETFEELQENTWCVLVDENTVLYQNY
jgi:hypothetical protein